MKNAFFNIFLLLNGLAASAQQTLVDTILHDGIPRDYRIYVPASYNGGKSVPLVFNLHGFTSNALEQEYYSNMNAVADTAGFIVCYPNGVGNAWNVGWFFGSTADDVDFISTLIDELSSAYNIDSAQVYACGMSNGGFMSYRLACELNNRIAAVASVTGSIAPPYQPQCKPQRPVPAMEVHGTADPVVPYNGLPLISVPVDSVVAFWLKNNNCALTPVVTPVPDIDPNDGCTATRIHYQICDKETEFLFYKIDNGGHTWPGADTTIGVTNQDFDASVEIWRFFRRFQNITIGTEELPSPADVLAYPNPAGERVIVRLPENAGLQRYTLFSSTGALLMRGNLQGAQTEINLSAVPAGLCWLVLEGSSGRVGKVLVKN